MVDLATVQDDLDLCRSAVGSQSWAAARRYLTQAIVGLAGLPTEVRQGSAATRLDRDLDRLTGIIDRAEASAVVAARTNGPLAFTSFAFKSPGASS